MQIARQAGRQLSRISAQCRGYTARYWELLGHYGLRASCTTPERTHEKDRC